MKDSDRTPFKDREVSTTDRLLAMVLGSFLFRGKGSTVVDQGAYVAVPFVVREAARRGYSGATSKDDPSV